MSVQQGRRLYLAMLKIIGLAHAFTTAGSLSDFGLEEKTCRFGRAKFAQSKPSKGQPFWLSFPGRRQHCCCVGYCHLLPESGQSVVLPIPDTHGADRGG
jgi:hypothetical protein